MKTEVTPEAKKTPMYSCKGSGNPVLNQFIVSFPDGREYFQSYETIMVFKPSPEGPVYLDRDSWDYSATTGNYRNQYLGEGIAETRKKIADGTYKLVSLNK